MPTSMPRAPRSTALAGAGVSLDDVTHKLEVDGVKSFSDSFDSLIGTIRQSLDAQRAA